MPCHPPTSASVERRTNQDLAELNLLGCWQRSIAREINHHLTSPHPVTPTARQHQKPSTTAATGLCHGPGLGHLLGYGPITTDQHPQLQVDAHQRAGCERVVTETASSGCTNRPVLTQVLNQLRPGDTLVVWKPRPPRPLRHLVDTITRLAERGVGFRSLQEAIDTTTPGGQLAFHIFAALAEFERDLIREPTSAGLAAARARGRRGGRPRS